MLTVHVQAEKQVYQLELVNREKNYNQIFNATPCVGVLNPLRHSKVSPHSQTRTHTVWVLVYLIPQKKAPNPPAESVSYSRQSSAPSLGEDRSKLPALVSSSSVAPRLTASDVELSRRSSPPARLRPHQPVNQSPLTRRKLTKRDTVF